MKSSERDQIQCPCCKECKDGASDFQKVVDLKDAGLVIYRHIARTEDLNKDTGAVEFATTTTEDVYILHNTKDMELSSINYLPEFEKSIMNCPRCRKIIDHVQKFLQKLPIFNKNDVKGMCEHCKTKEAPCFDCKAIVKKFVACEFKRVENNKQRVNEWLTKIKHLLKDTIDTKTGTGRERPHSELYIDQLCRESSKPGRELNVKQIFQPGYAGAFPHSIEKRKKLFTHFPSLEKLEKPLVFLNSVEKVDNTSMKFKHYTSQKDGEDVRNTTVFTPLSENVRQGKLVELSKNIPPVPFHSEENIHIETNKSLEDFEQILRHYVSDEESEFRKSNEALLTIVSGVTKDIIQQDFKYVFPKVRAPDKKFKQQKSSSTLIKDTQNNILLAKSEKRKKKLELEQKIKLEEERKRMETNKTKMRPQELENTKTEKVTATASKGKVKTSPPKPEKQEPKSREQRGPKESAEDKDTLKAEKEAAKVKKEQERKEKKDRLIQLTTASAAVSKGKVKTSPPKPEKQEPKSREQKGLKEPAEDKDTLKAVKETAKVKKEPERKEKEDRLIQPPTASAAASKGKVKTSHPKLEKQEPKSREQRGPKEPAEDKVSLKAVKEAAKVKKEQERKQKEDRLIQLPTASAAASKGKVKTSHPKPEKQEPKSREQRRSKESAEDKDTLKALKEAAKVKNEQEKKEKEDRSTKGMAEKEKLKEELRKNKESREKPKQREKETAKLEKDNENKENNKESEVDKKDKSSKEVKHKVKGTDPDDLILQLVKLKKSEQKNKPKILAEMNLNAKDVKIHKKYRRRENRSCILSDDSSFDIDAESNAGKKDKDISEIIIGEKILKYKAPQIEKDDQNIEPLVFQSTFNVNETTNTTRDTIIIPGKHLDQEQPKGVIRYALSDRSFIDKGWTMLPMEKVVRKLNVYRMRPAQPEFDWFEHNKNKRLMEYDSGEKLADFDENGRGRWFYKNGRMALDYYDAEELNAQQRLVIYSSGEPDERGRTQPYTLLATFDYLGNGIVFDHGGKIRLKYNQTEGVVLDRSIGPVSHWKWHTLNDPPVLQQVMIDTQMAHKDPDIMTLGGPGDNKSRPDNEDMLAIEFDNFIKEKSKKLTQSFKPFQIKMKALKINEHFSLKVLDQATVYLIFRDGTTNLKLNIGMVLDHKEIVDTDTAEVGEVSNNIEKLPARTESVAKLQKNIAHAQHYNRTRTERERRLRPPEPCGSADKLIAAASRPLRTGLSGSTTTAGDRYCKCSRKPTACNVYYDTNIC